MRRFMMWVALCTAAAFLAGPSITYAQHDDPDMEWEDSGTDVASVDTGPAPLLSRIGGKMAVMGVVNDLINRVMNDTRLNKRFSGADRAELRTQWIGQFIDASGGPKYSGKDLKASRQLSGADWEAFTEDLSGALEKFRVGEAERNELLIRLKLKEGVLPDTGGATGATGGAPTAASTSSTLYDRIGGKTAIMGVVSEFAARVMADKRLSRHFSNADLTKWKRQLIGQLSDASGGPKFFGKKLKESQKERGLSEKDLYAMTEDLSKALDWFEIGQTEKEELLSSLELKKNM